MRGLYEGFLSEMSVWLIDWPNVWLTEWDWMSGWLKCPLKDCMMNNWSPKSEPRLLCATSSSSSSLFLFTELPLLRPNSSLSYIFLEPNLACRNFPVSYFFCEQMPCKMLILVRKQTPRLLQIIVGFGMSLRLRGHCHCSMWPPSKQSRHHTDPHDMYDMFK